MAGLRVGHGVVLEEGRPLVVVAYGYGGERRARGKPAGAEGHFRVQRFAGFDLRGPLVRVWRVRDSLA